MRPADAVAVCAEAGDEDRPAVGVTFDIHAEEDNHAEERPKARP
jgi:hypothetical protein